MMPQDNDLLGAEPARCNYAAQSYCAVTYDGDNVAGYNLRRDSRVVTCAHHIGQGKQRWHQRIIFSHRENEQGTVGERDAYGFGLRTRNLHIAKETAMHARSLQAIPAELTGAIGPGERHD